MKILLYGLITGIFFGFFLQRGQVLRYEKQLGALRLMDMTIVKFMLSGFAGVQPATSLIRRHPLFPPYRLYKAGPGHWRRLRGCPANT